MGRTCSIITQCSTQMRDCLCVPKSGSVCDFLSPHKHAGCSSSVLCCPMACLSYMQGKRDGLQSLGGRLKGVRLSCAASALI